MIKIVYLCNVFHGIRFKVNKRLGLGGAPFFMPIRQHVEYLSCAYCHILLFILYFCKPNSKRQTT